MYEAAQNFLPLPPIIRDGATWRNAWEYFNAKTQFLVWAYFSTIDDDQSLDGKKSSAVKSPPPLSSGGDLISRPTYLAILTTAEETRRSCR